MAVLDRTTRRLIANLKAKVRILIALVLVLSVALGVMTFLYVTKDDDAQTDVTIENSSSEDASSTEIPSNTESVNDLLSSSEQSSSSEVESKTESKVESKKEDSSSSKEESSSSSVSSAAVSSSESSKPATSSTASASSLSESSTETVATGDSINSWNLKLVNAKNPLPNGFTAKTEKIKASYARDVGMRYDARAVSYLNAMCAAAEKDGINLLVISSYRTNARQTTLFNNQVKKQRANYPNLSEDELKKKAATISAYPGTSEHELGLAVDFNSVEESFENTPEYQWLKTHAAEYGFILRYTKEKQSITGVIYEPWHYRFVGKNHAKKINELGYCLEEYIDYLSKQGK